MTVVSVDRWSWYRGALVSLKWTVNQPTVDSIDRWSLYVSSLLDMHVLLYIVMHFLVTLWG